jgi:hypothetical protein
MVSNILINSGSCLFREFSRTLTEWNSEGIVTWMQQEQQHIGGLPIVTASSPSLSAADLLSKTP